ncbi:MAG: hypothetical protein Q8R12_01485, partial [bacterium]|nr:hypothetical protein [bacterium]
MNKYLKIFAVFLIIFAYILYVWPANNARGATLIPIITTGTSTWTVPGDWNNGANSVEVIGGGGGGASGGNGDGTAGGGGGAYSSTTNISLTPGASITVFVGAGGAAAKPGGAGNFTLFNVNGSSEGCLDADVCAAGGGGGGTHATAVSATTTGAAASRGFGTTKYSGGDGGPGNGAGDSGGGGGGAAGVKGDGRYGGVGHASATAGGGGGGGGAGGGVSNFGKPGSSTKGGDGGAGPTGTAGGTGGTGTLGAAGSNGSGGGGSDNDITGAAGAGGTGQEWATTTSFGAGAGGGGGGDTGDGGAGGLYGGGGGGGEGTGKAGGQGIIVIQYTPVFVISGTLYNDEGLNADTSGGDVIKLAIATGTTPGLYATTTRTNGFFDFKIPYSTGFTAATGAPMVLWLDGQASKAVAVTKASSTETMSFITDLNLYKNRVIAKHEGTTGTSTTIADFQRYDKDNDTDIPYIANGGTLTVSAGNGLYIFPGSEFAPGGAVTISGNGPSGVFPDGVLRLASNSTSSIMTLGSNNLTLAGSLFASSTSILSNSGTITFNATTTGKQIIASSTPTRALGNVTFNGAGGGWTFGDNASTTNFNITNGSVTAPTLLSVGGNYTNSGTFTHNSGTVYFSGTSAQTLFGVMATSSPFNNVEFLGAGTKTFGASYASTSAFTINSGSGTVTAPSTILSISGNYSNSGTFTHNSGTILFDGTSAQTLSGTMAISSAFNNVQFSEAGTKSFGSTGFASTTNFSVQSTSGAVTAPSGLLSITGNYYATSTFTHNSGTILFDKTSGNQNIGAATGTGAFNNVQFFGAATKQFVSQASTTNFIINGGSGAVTVSGANGQNGGLALLSISGSYSATSTFTHNSGTILFDGSGAQTIQAATGTWAFNNVQFFGGGTKTFSGNASTSAFTIQGGSAVTAPTLLSVGGNYSNLGTFTAGNGTTTLNGTSAQTISGVATGTSAFYNLEILNSSASTTFAAAASTTKNFYVVTAGAKVEFAAGATSSITHLIINGQAANTSINLFSGTPGTQWNLYATGTRSVQFARVQDSDACSDTGDIDATGGTNTNVGNNECWTFISVVAATATSTANQTFEINQAATAISKLTVTAGADAGAITAANGLRIAIATSTVNMLWDTTVTKALFGGVASSSAKIASCACIGYEGGGSVATTSVITDFSSGDVLTVSGLKFTSFNTAVASSTAIQLFLDGANDTSANAQDTMRSVAIYGKLALANHASGQKTNKFDQGGATLTNQEVYSFKFTTTGENSSTTPTISLSEVSG